MGVNPAPGPGRDQTSQGASDWAARGLDPQTVHAKFVVAQFDPALDREVRAIWDLLESGGFETPRRTGGTPHLSFGGVELLREAEFGASFGTQETVPVRLSYVGTFGAGRFMWVGAAPSAELLEMHTSAYRAMLAASSEQPDAMYLPGTWIPHCTLAHNVAPERQTDFMQIASRLRLPLEGTITSIELIDVTYPR